MNSKIPQIAPIKLRGRTFSVNDLQVILLCVDKYFDAGRTRISKEVCKKLDWKQPNGWLKDRACRDVLRCLHELDIIELPPPKIARKTKNKSNIVQDSSFKDILEDYDLETPIENFPSDLDIVFAKGNKQEAVWNAVIDKYHYLGHSVIVGRSIKYLVQIDSRIVAAISFASPAWNLEPRNELLSVLGIQNPLDNTINNTRFLITPGIQVKNLASHILSKTTREVVKDWNSYYCIKPLVAETFVHPSRYEGTCYKAANWLKIGTTKGYAKRGISYSNSQEPKDIYIYGLERELRREIINLIKRGQ